MYVCHMCWEGIRIRVVHVLGGYRVVHVLGGYTYKGGTWVYVLERYRG